MLLSRWYSKPSQDIIKELQTDVEKGLSSEEAKRRLEKYGPNQFEEGEKNTIWKMLWDQINDPLIWILMVAAGISAAVGEWVDSLIILAIVILNAIIGVVQESKAEKALEALKEMSTPHAFVKRDGEVKEIPAQEVVPGDIVLIDAGRAIPADIRLLETANLQIEESALTGESVPVDKDASFLSDEDIPLGDQINMAFMNTVSTYGRGVGVVVGTGMNTEMGKIAKMLGSQEKEITPLQKSIAQLSKILSVIALIVCALFFIVGAIQGRDILEMFLTAISLAVAAIPEGLVAIVTIVLAIGMTNMSKRNAIVRKLPAVETLGSVSVICSDKTGTLTQNKMTVTKIFVNGKEIDMDQVSADDEATNELLSGMSLCSDATETTGDPTEIALVVAAKKIGQPKEQLDQTYKRVFELPFDSDRKRMTTVHQAGDRYVSYTKGALESILPNVTSIYKDGQVRPITEEDKEEIRKASEAMSDQALRVLALAKRENITEQDFNEQLETNLTFIGLTGMIDPPREEVKDSIRQTKSAGITTVMITGDHPKTALAIAKELGIASSINQTMTGAEIDAATDEELQERVKTVRVFARVSPEHKVRIVKAIKANGKIASMTGDGVNDAPSLKQADVGVAMGITGTDVAKGASDIILTDDNFATIVSAVEQGRNIFANIKKAVLFLLSCNLGEITALFLGILLKLPTPLTAVQILFVNLITDSLPAISLGMDPDDPDIMKQKPRDPKESILHNNYLFIIGNGILIGLLTLIAFVFELNMEVKQLYAEGVLASNSIFAQDWSMANLEANPALYDALIHAQTLAFVTLVIAQLSHSLNMRNRTKSIFQVGLFSNKYLVGAILIGIAIQFALVYVPGLNTVFNIYRLDDPADFMMILVAFITPIVINEIIKAFRRMFLKKNEQDETYKAA